MSNYHTDPRQLILEAAERSGLLKEVAELIWFANKYGSEERPTGRCPQCELVEDLADAFDDHTGITGIVCVHVYGDRLEGVDISPAAGTEAAEFESFYAKFCAPEQAKLEESR